MTDMRWAAWICVVAGACLAGAPFVAGYDATNTTATFEAVITGLLIAAIAVWAALRPVTAVHADFFLTVLGGWSIVASFVLGYSGLEIARNVDIAAGVVVAAVSLFNWIYTSAGARRRVAA